MSPSLRRDAFDLEIGADGPETIAAWNSALDLYFRFRGDPVGAVEAASQRDETFLRGPIFTGVMKLLGGQRPDHSAVARDLQRARARADSATAIERQHLDAFETLAQGRFTRAADTWDRILEAAPNDMMALKCSHEAYFYAGNFTGMLASAGRALARLEPAQAGYGVALGQYAFALEESGDYAAAERHARRGLDISAEDCWSLHCLAHVYEMQDRQADALDLLRTTQPVWSEQNLLSAHIWWHLALRLVEAERFEEVLEIFDSTLGAVPADNPFRLTDGTSLLWRLELAGVSVGRRWHDLADKWATHAETHSNAFLDLHAALAFAACPDQAAAERFWHSLATAHDGDASENAVTFKRVAVPLAAALRAFRRGDHGRAAESFESVRADLHRIGGSRAQRELVDRSHAVSLLTAGRQGSARRFLESRLADRPGRAWILRDLARLSDAEKGEPGR